jgi:protein-disulfide isomerase
MPPRKTTKTVKKAPTRKSTAASDIYAPRQPKSNPWFTATLTLLGLLVGVLIGYGAGSGDLNFGFGFKSKYPLIFSTENIYQNLPRGVDENGDEYIGNPAATVVLTEYSDFQCPYCERHFQAAHSQIITNFVATGQAKFVYKDFPLSFHANAGLAAQTAECAGEQNLFWEMHDTIFLNQQLWAESAQAKDIFKEMARGLGLKKSQFNTCLDNGITQAEVNADFNEGVAAGVSGTPTLFVNGEPLVGALPYEAFQQAIGAAIDGVNDSEEPVADADIVQ